MAARRKGNSGEMEAIRWIQSQLYGRSVGMKRNLEQSRSGGGDIVRHPFVWEIKRRRGDKNLGFAGWWAQVQKAVKRVREEEHDSSYVPVVMFRRDRGPWEFLIPATYLGVNVGYIHVDITVFKAWVKNEFGIKPEPTRIEKVIERTERREENRRTGKKAPWLKS